MTVFNMITDLEEIISDTEFAPDWYSFFNEKYEQRPDLLEFIDYSAKIGGAIAVVSKGIGFKTNAFMMQENPTKTTQLFAVASLWKLLEEIHEGRILWDKEGRILDYTIGERVTVLEFLQEMEWVAFTS